MLSYKNILLSFFSILGLGCSKIKTDKKIMRISIGVPETHFEYKAMLKFKEHLAQNSKIDVKLFPSNQLGSDQEALESMRFGVLHMNLPDPAVLGNMVQEFNLLSLPFIFTDQETANKVVDGPWGQELLKKLEAKGYVGLGFGDFGFRHITNSKKAISNQSDLQGLKIRTMQNPIHLDVFRTLGANPTPISFSEVFSSLQQGVIDGQENPLKNISSNKLFEVQKYLTLSGHVYSFVVFVVSKGFYDSLDQNTKTVLRQAARIAIDHMRVSVNKEDAEALDVLLKSGMKVTRISPKDRDEIAQTVEPTKLKHAKNINLSFYEELVKEIETHSGAKK
ncbi:MAG: TRAP transporter substrate-binding protein [Lentisphaeraceae bacterium]|nr:TRAP transporter substrate-binding protein [Lentisphaeraceae bacterium]